MIVQLFYFLAAMLVLTGLVAWLEPVLTYAALTQLLLVLVVRFGNLHYPRWVLVSTTAILLLAVVLIWSAVHALPATTTLFCLVVVSALLTASWHSYASLLSAVAVALPACGVVQLWTAYFDGADPAIGAALVLWTVACWPMIGLLAHGRLWAVAASFGCGGLLSVMMVILRTVDGRAWLLWDILSQGWRYTDPLVTAGQILLMLVSVTPLLIESTRLWRGATLVGGLGVGLPLLLTWYAGPWADGWPVTAWIFILPSAGLACFGGVGLLCTVRRHDLLGTTAVRALALGAGASAVLLLPVLMVPPAQEHIIPVLSLSVAPMLWGILLALFAAVAALVAQRLATPEIDTERLVRSRQRVARDLRHSLSAYVSGIAHSVVSTRGRWWRPEAVVPLLICASSYPAWSVLGWQHLAVLSLLVPGVLIRPLLDGHLLLWTACQVVLLAAATLLLGGSWPGIVALVAVGVGCGWLFIRWSRLNAAWAYPGSLLVLVIVWLPWLPVHPEPALVVTGVAILLANAFLFGPARWISLPVTTLASLLFLWFWIPGLDRYVLAIFDDRSIWQDAAAVLVRMPMVSLLLAVLWLNRVESRGDLVVFDDRLRGILHTATLVVAVAWASGYRPSWPIALILVGVVAVVVQRSAFSLPMLDRAGMRWPILDGMAMMLASVLVAVGGAHSTWLAYRAADRALGGSLGVHLLEAQHDVLSIVCAVLAVLVLHRWLDWYVAMERRLHRTRRFGLA